MEVKSCRRCKRLFNYLVGPYLCPVCKEELENKFAEVKAFIRDNPTCNLNEVAEKCDIEKNQLTLWIREERLQFSEEAGSVIGCERCGVPIRTGKLCEKCKNEVAKTLNQTLSTMKAAKKPQDEIKPSGARMRFLDR